MQFILRFACWISAAYFFYLANVGYGYPPNLTGSSGIALLIAIVLFLLPFAKSLTVTGLFSYEARIDEVKKEVSEFKSETRDILRIQNSLISNVSANQTTHNVFNIPSLTDAATAEKQIPTTELSSANNKAAERIESAAAIGPTELNFELARTRIDLERLLREKVGRSTLLGGRRDTKYMSIIALWREYLQENPGKKNFDAAMRYVVDICNAAIHGQNVPSENAVEALNLGEEIKAALE